MPQKSIETILIRQLITYLAMPAFIVDSDGKIIFLNQPAEKILGLNYSESSEIPAENWHSLFAPRDKQGRAVPIDKLPLTISATEFRISQSSFYISTLKNETKHIDLVAIPLVNHMDTVIGSMVFFQEIPA